MDIKNIAGPILGVVAVFSVLQIPIIGQVAAWQKVLLMSILGTTFIALWGKNKF